MIVLGEDIGRFRDASKELYGFLKQWSWSGKVERLGFDEVWMDVTDIVDYNVELLNNSSLSSSFFQLAKNDPLQGFAFDATAYAGHTYPESEGTPFVPKREETLALRLRLGSHFAMHLRHKLEDEKGYTSTVGISTCKLLSKLAGNLHKPKGQTTIIPPYSDGKGAPCSNVMAFVDDHEVRKIPGIGSKLAQKIRDYVLQRAADLDAGSVHGDAKEKITVRNVRLWPGINPESLEKLLGGPGSPHGIGLKVWQLLHGVDDSEVSLARPVPRQISIEDSYVRLDTLPEVSRELNALTCSLVSRMRIDLVVDDCDEDSPETSEDVNDAIGMERKDPSSKKWLAHPRTIRLTTRPRPPLNVNCTRTRTFKRISHSAPLPNFVFSIGSPVGVVAGKLVQDTLIPMFHKLHPERAGWNLSLINVAVTNMAETAGSSKTASGRDIGTMFKRQDEVLKDFRVIDEDDAYPQLVRASLLDEQLRRESSDEVPAKAQTVEENKNKRIGYDQMVQSGEDLELVQWDDEEEEVSPRCHLCGTPLPVFALSAHMRYHSLGD